MREDSIAYPQTRPLVTMEPLSLLQQIGVGADLKVLFAANREGVQHGSKRSCFERFRYLPLHPRSVASVGNIETEELQEAQLQPRRRS